MKAQLVVVQGKPRNLTRALNPGECLIGRGEECHVRTNSPWVSRQHCLLRVGADEVVINDLGSTNGTLVNGKRVVAERVLQSGDLLQIGVLVFQLQLEVDSAGLKDTESMVERYTPPPRVDATTRKL